MANCNDCIHRKVCVILAFPEAFENTEWEKEPCDHFKDADVAPKSEVEELEKEVERLTDILNSYALQYGTVADKEVFLKKARAEGAKELANSIKTYYDHIDKTVGALINYTIDQKLKEFLGEGGGKENG